MTATRSILWFTPLAHTFHELEESVRKQRSPRSSAGDGGVTWSHRGLELRLDVVSRLEDAVGGLDQTYYSLVVVDCRDVPHEGADLDLQERAVEAFLDVQRQQRDGERRFPRGRVVVLVGGPDAERVDRMMFRLGELHVGAAVRDRSLAADLSRSRRDEARRALVEELWATMRRLLNQRSGGRRSINCAGGGISGIYYELGVLKCLHDALDCDIRDFDMFFGISGGAVVASCLANGFHIDDLLVKVGDMDNGWRYKLRVGWKQLNVAEVPRRLLLAQRELLSYLMRMLRRQDDFSIASVLGTYAVVLGPIFDNSDFEKVLRRLFSSEGHSNDFRRLQRELYIGATDQDRREAVLFGAEGHDDVPISVAVQASSAMQPFFPPVEVGGRFYSDGVLTRTSNLRGAIERDADLVFVIDPFVPLISDEAGFNARHGNMWLLEQDLKTMAFTRFANARDEIARANQHVRIYTFLPSNRMRHLMSSQNPFVARNFHPIVCEAYRSTYRRLKALEYKLSGELAGHGIGLALEPVQEKVELLRDASAPDVRLLLDDEALERIA